MVPKTQTRAMMVEDEQPHAATVDQAKLRTMRIAGAELAARVGWLPGASSDTFSVRCKKIAAHFKTIFAGVETAFAKAPNSEDLLWLRDNSQQLSSEMRATTNDLAPLTDIPHVSTKDEVLPRVLAMAQGYFAESETTFSKTSFTEFCLAFEEAAPLEFHEVGALVPALKLVLLEKIAAQGVLVVTDPAATPVERIPKCIRTLEAVSQTSWKDVLEHLIPFDRILRQDPVGAYAAMDVESRNTYRERVAKIAQRSDLNEIEVAEEALALARQAHGKRYNDPRIQLRESHIGYYLVGEGATVLGQRVGSHPKFGERFPTFLRQHPAEFLLLGIAVLTFVITTAAVWLLTAASTPLLLVLLSMLFLFLPGTQAAVQVMNYLTTNLLPTSSLAKLDFSDGIPDDCKTLVAIPTLLLNEKQVRGLVEKLEVRFLGNHDPNLHFALVSDLPDSPKPAPEDDALVELCSKLIDELNERYAPKNSGSFFLLHRHRIYNPRERGWMGWERKRGKLLDLNRLMRGQFDSFPVKIGDLSILSKIRYVITLDSDTELPRGSAHRMVGAIAHPLNQAIIDPVNNIVVAGYGILQPRVDVSVQSTARSRLAAIFAGESGLDPYTRAVSDVYQDLFGEGTFTGKGIYEVDTMDRVLSHRFPRNALLSHDLIEGSYARAGLATDVVVIEDYPSHYSAYSRRKHRWLRGDWQIVEWLTDRVPDESGARVANPISLVSRWKILDNLRRSLVEPATFALFLFGWFVTDHPYLWTLAAICILFVPAWVEFCFGLTRAVIARRVGVARDAAGNLFATNFSVLLTLTLLAHQTLLSLDAVARALVRRLVTRERLLEWETAAEAELGERRTAIDRYLDWMPLLGVGLGLLLWLVRPHALLAAVPILALWAGSKGFVLWLNSSPLEEPPETTSGDAWLLRKSALHIWRYFAEFSNEEHNWLVPDNIEDKPRKVAASVSPTNVGLLLNARQVANELGYITVPELVDLSQKTLRTIDRLPKYRGHLMNWYETRTLKAKPPLFISSVDSGNLVASLWTLDQGCRDVLRRPLVSKALAEGLLDHLRVLVKLRALPKRLLSRCENEFQTRNWLSSILSLTDEEIRAKTARAQSEPSSDLEWFSHQVQSRVSNIRDLVGTYTPWKLPEFSALRQELAKGGAKIDDVPLQQLPDLILELERRLDLTLQSGRTESGAAEALMARLKGARENVLRLVEDLRQIADQARSLGNAMDFTFLLDKQRHLLSVGFDAGTEELQPYCYNLLATEPRTAVFIAIAKEDIPQDCWFRLDRPYTLANGHMVLLSWTGTMFEYLMPSIWMRLYPNTLLDRACVAAVRTQQDYAALKGILWGISESACAKRNDAGDYHYEAFGAPNLAIKKSDSDPMIVSPYSTFLALNLDRKNALANLRKMDALGWFGSYGFYEAADYGRPRKRLLGPKYELVLSWMVHHQGMSLLSLANFLCDNVVQCWFHADRRVQATELLLQEKPVSHMRSA